jgi:hypothetical protein
MGRTRNLFGPLFYWTATLATVTLLGLGVWERWPSWSRSWRVRSLAQGLRDGDPLIRRRAHKGLAQAGEAGVPWLLDAARDRDPDVRALAFEGLARTVLTRSAIPTLRAGLSDEDARVRREAADSLARLGVRAQGVRDDLNIALNDGDPDVRFRAARALLVLNSQESEAAIQALIALAGSPVVPRDPGRFAVVSLIRATVHSGSALKARIVEAAPNEKIVLVTGPWGRVCRRPGVHFARSSRFRSSNALSRLSSFPSIPDNRFSRVAGTLGPSEAAG